MIINSERQEHCTLKDAAGVIRRYTGEVEFGGFDAAGDGWSAVKELGAGWAVRQRARVAPSISRAVVRSRHELEESVGGRGGSDAEDVAGAEAWTIMTLTGCEVDDHAR